VTREGSAGGSPPGFLRFWWGEAVSGFGDAITSLGLQTLVAITLQSGAVQVGWLNSARWLPYLVLGLVVGALVDRARRRPVMVVDTLPIEVEAERFRSAITKDEGGNGLCLIIKPVQLGKPVRAVDGLDIAQNTAGADRRELLIITDQPDAASSLHDEVDCGVEGEGVGHTRFVDDHQHGLGGAGGPVGQVAVINGPAQLRQRVGRRTDALAELGGCCGRGRESEHLAAAVGPRPGKGAQGRGLPAPAGAIASCSRDPDMLIERTKAACPGSKVTRLAACSSSASSTISAGAVRPSLRSATVTSRCSAARMRAEVNSRSLQRCRRSTRRGGAGPPVR
jgi:hypothetical protein